MACLEILYLINEEELRIQKSEGDILTTEFRVLTSKNIK